MKSQSCPRPPVLVFPDRRGGFFLFENPSRIFPGPDLAEAEAWAASRGLWLAGGLEYGPAEVLGPGWWGAFPPPQTLTADELEPWADASPVVTGPLSSPIGFDDYEHSFGRVRQALASGNSYQVNLTFPVEGRAVSGQPWTWRSALRLWLDLVGAQGREGAFAVLGTEDAPGPVLVSASPELFFEREGAVVHARPMKGTAPRSDDPEVDGLRGQALVADPKCRAENLMVTDMLRNDLGRLAVPGGVSVPRLFELEAYPTVWQMTSTVRAVLAGEPRLTDLMKALFPCASITGAPKVSTQAVIAQVEPASRGWYCGTLGWHQPGSPVLGPPRSRFSVLIRTPVFDGEPGTFRLGVGGGIVWDSRVRDEWDEAWTKTRFLAPTRRTFSLTEALLWEPGPGFFLLDEHRNRLARACRDFGGRLDPSSFEAVLDAAVEEARGRGETGPLKVRALVDPEFRLKAEAAPLGETPNPLTGALAPRPLGPESLLWRRYKTSNRAVYDESRVPGVDQTLHYNERGELTESTSMNLVLEKGGRFLTPALSSGLLAGTFRARLLAEGVIEEAVLPREALEDADRIWLINSVRRWQPLRLAGADAG